MRRAALAHNSCFTKKQEPLTNPQLILAFYSGSGSFLLRVGKSRAAVIHSVSRFFDSENDEEQWGNGGEEEKEEKEEGEGEGEEEVDGEGEGGHRWGA